MVNHPNRKKEAEVSHAEQNAAAWYDSIAEVVAALEVDYDRLEELTDELTEVRDGEGGQNTGTLKSWAAEAAGDGGHLFRDAAAEYLELLTDATVEGEIQTDADAVRERIQEGPLSVEVRSGWYAPGGDNTPEEFCILLSTGGPALRLVGDLDEHGEPTRAYLQHQDWGTPWTDYYAGEGSGAVLLTYARQFYFGEG